MNMKKAVVFLADGFEEVEALTVVDLLRRAGVLVDTVSVSGKIMVKGSHGIEVKTEALVGEEDFAEVSLVVLPGGMPGTLHLKEHAQVRRICETFFADGRLVAAICAAPTVLADIGLLEGRNATCYPAMEEKMAGAILSREPVVADGNIITSRGVGTAIAFALKLIQALMGKEKADEIGQSIVYQ